ncbi:Uncharacterised protein [uncultured archaeon]|nr:Uncharacterised protein [uncultured archaeon]
MDLPDSYSSYDASAVIAQRGHFQLILFELSSAVVISIISLIIAISHQDTTSRIGFLIIFFIFLIGIILQLYASKKQYERKWFAFRAVAESIKSLAWQYAMACGDFNKAKDANKLLIQRIKDVKEIFQINPYPKTISIGVLDEIKSSMVEARKIEWQDKRDIYIIERLEDQITWYTNKAKNNRQRSELYDGLIIVLQIVGIGICLFLLYTLPIINGAPALALIVTLIAGIIGWSRSKQHAELVEPYQNAARELNNIGQEIKLADEEADFCQLVEEAEQAISREHIMWLAKRGLCKVSTLE